MVTLTKEGLLQLNITIIAGILILAAIQHTTNTTLLDITMDAGLNEWKISRLMSYIERGGGPTALSVEELQEMLKEEVKEKIELDQKMEMLRYIPPPVYIVAIPFGITAIITPLFIASSIIEIVSMFVGKQNSEATKAGIIVFALGLLVLIGVILFAVGMYYWGVIDPIYQGERPYVKPPRTLD